MNVRAAAESDAQSLRELWEAFEAEVPEPDGFTPEAWDDAWKWLRTYMTSGVVLIAEEDGVPVGMLEASPAEATRWHVETVYVKPAARRRGVAKALLRECADRARKAGVGHVSLGVLVANQPAVSIWRRLGFDPVETVMAQPLESLELRLADEPMAPSRASVHVQSDDRASVERAVGHFVPKLLESDLHPASNGWIRVSDPVLDADRAAHSRLARELSDALGAVVVALALEVGAVVRFQLYERGSMVDEYLSVPTFYGALPKGDELALAANPTLVARLTGADREEVRHVARTASTPGELPPAAELYEQIATLMGLEA
jgi:ribosomal protein S18 acetylase RimI-like enzyme